MQKMRQIQGDGLQKIQRTQGDSIHIVRISQGGGGRYVTYDGETTITPQVHNQVVLETAGKLMIKDVTVLKVPYLETANLSGGNTAWIGENVNG